MKVPSSFRFPERLMNSLKARAESRNKSLTEHVQTVLEASLDNEDCEKKHYFELMEHPDESISDIYVKLFSASNTQATRLSLSELKFMIHYCHHAYLYHRHAVSNDYIKVIIDISLDLVEASLSENITFNKHYVYRCFDLSDENLDGTIRSIKEVVNKCIDSTYAEYLTRPLESAAFNFSQYRKETIDLIFTKERLQKLFPLVTRGILKNNKEKQRIKEFAQSTPSHRVEFNVDDLNFSIVCYGSELKYDEPASVFFVIEGKHFINPYSLKRLLAIIRLINRDELDNFSTLYNDSDKVSIWPPNLANKYGTIDIDSFRLLYEPELYNEFKEKLLKAIEDEKMSAILSAMKIMHGDI
ncbi:hypothetical protein [Xenorhabdus sp. KJ12.1]|uniref:hypothetical protein n=1 Tax=Xenorhabdus sp. KJ12.1 TaxID=1851571 RepID=UPI000C056FE0|nr:hypothetical protein [Xenorhabdus sp. KJ12.1]